jgi:hypothetical protein
MVLSRHKHCLCFQIQRKPTKDVRNINARVGIRKIDLSNTGLERDRDIHLLDIVSCVSELLGGVVLCILDRTVRVELGAFVTLL